MTTAAEIHHWQTLTLRDAETMTTWLSAIGFAEHATYRNEADPAVVVHAEWVWPGGAGIMFGTEREDAVGSSTVGTSACYLVSDDPDALFRAAVAAGASVEQDLVDQDYGGRGATVRDPEGNLWSFGSYQPR